MTNAESGNPRHIPIPVTQASATAEAFEKDLVVIIGWDMETQSLETATWGRFPAAKDWAAKLGELCAQAAGAEVSQTTWNEDYRATKEAEFKAQIDTLQALVERYRSALEEIATMTVPYSRSMPPTRLAKDALIPPRNREKPVTPEGVRP